MKYKTLAMAVLIAAGSLSGTAALAQDKVQFFPSLTGRTGPVRPTPRRLPTATPTT